jgi:hypothetical protein
VRFRILGNGTGVELSASARNGVSDRPAAWATCRTSAAMTSYHRRGVRHNFWSASSPGAPPRRLRHLRDETATVGSLRLSVSVADCSADFSDVIR